MVLEIINVKNKDERIMQSIQFNGNVLLIFGTICFEIYVPWSLRRVRRLWLYHSRNRSRMVTHVADVDDDH